MGATPSGGECCDKVEIVLQTQKKQRGCFWQSLRHPSAVAVFPLKFLSHSDDALQCMFTPSAALPHVRSAKCKGWNYATKRCMLGCSNWILSSMHKSRDKIFVKKEYVTTVLRQKLRQKLRNLRHLLICNKLRRWTEMRLNQWNDLVFHIISTFVQNVTQ